MTSSPRSLLSLALFSASLLALSTSHAAPKRSPKRPAPEPVVEQEERDEPEEAFEDEENEEPEDALPEPSRRPHREPADEAPRKTWLSLGVAGDLAWVSGKNVCALESQRDNGYSCFRNGDSGKLEQYYGEPVLGEANSISPGFRLRTGRVLLGIDHAVSSSFTVGGRLGFAFNGGPKGENDAHGFLPLHLEGRLAYWFGDDPFARTGFRPYLFAAGGLAQVDSRMNVHVVEDTRPSHQPDNPEEQDLVVYKKMGQGFVGLGGGVLYALSKSGGIVVELKAMMMFPSPGQVLEPTLGYAIGF